jgi:hypothetical protein
MVEMIHYTVIRGLFIVNEIIHIGKIDFLFANLNDGKYRP